MADPFQGILEHQGAVMLDGGLATSLEERGHTLDSHLWSAKVLIDAPEEIVAVHRAFLDVGADCVTTASYQASYEGLSRLGFDMVTTDELLIRSVTLARDAVEDFWLDVARPRSRTRPLVAASIGPYGAYLGDGSEYNGRYGVAEQDLIDFHRRRFKLLATSGADLLACETIPSVDEARVLLELYRETPEARGWISFSCRDGAHLNDGTPIEDAVDLCERAERLVGIGVNCTAPQFVNELITRILPRTQRSVIVYPNSGESWDAKNKEWTGSCSTESWVEMAEMWHKTGARAIGGCCRIGPEVIRQVRGRIVSA